MEDARVRQTGDPLTGEDLWYMDDVEDYTYECVFCTVECRPCSYDKDVNQRRPHFRKLSDHDSDCAYISDDPEQIKKKKVSTIRTEDGKPGHYPSEFCLPKNTKSSGKNPTESRQKSYKESKEPHPRNSDKGFNTPPKKDRPYKTSSFRLIVNHYLNFPNDRDLPLQAESIDGCSFRNCFNNLFTNRDNPLIKPKNKIYNSALKWRKAEVKNDSIVVTFEAYSEQGSPNSDKPIKKNLFLEIDISSWSKKVRDSFLYDLEKGRNDIVKSQGSRKLLVFFMGEQNKNNPLKFEADNPRLISLNTVINKKL